MKRCSKCRIEKPLTDYWKNKRQKDGLQNQCVVCLRPQLRAAKKTEKYLEYMKEYRESDHGRQLSREAQRRYRETERGFLVRRESELRQRYGIASFEALEAMLQQQGGVCPVCQCRLISRGLGPSSLRVDHDHKTGKVRGLLCHHCNVAAGHLQDDPQLATNLAKYLKSGGFFQMPSA